jgi:hypothetical protein
MTPALRITQGLALHDVGRAHLVGHQDRVGQPHPSILRVADNLRAEEKTARVVVSVHLVDAESPNDSLRSGLHLLPMDGTPHIEKQAEYRRQQQCSPKITNVHAQALQINP